MELSNVQNEIFKSTDNLIVTAGAGSGKTRVLVEKYVKVFEENPDLRMDQVVAITFTEKAAREMKDRITKKIDENISFGKEVDLYMRIKRELPFARISTIHAFCSRIIRESALYANVDPDFNVVSGLASSRRISKLVESYMVNNVREMKKLFEIDPTIAFSDLREWFEDAIIKRTSDDILPVKINDDLKEIFLDHAKNLIEEYEKMAKEESTLDFEDLLIMTKDLLSNDSELRHRYSDYFRYIFVDEFQDTNKIQSEIIELLRSDLNRVWYIGDPKQSIYAFRGADVGVFLDITERSQDKNISVKEMNENHRSKPNLVKFYNRFFSKVFNGRIRYSDQISQQNDEEKRVILLDNPGSEKAYPARMIEAKSIAGMIGEFTSKGHALSDITILLRSMGDVWAIENELVENKIPYHVIGGKAFFSRKEVLALDNLMAVILDPYDVSTMTGLLMSPFFDLTIDEILELKRKDKFIYDALKIDYPQIHDLIEKLVQIKNTVDASKIIKMAINETRYLGKIALQKDGDKSIANVMKFIETLDSFDLPSWDINGIHKIMEKGLGENEEEASALSEEENVVKIMTVHKSKGLEFPIVIMAQMSKKPKDDGETEKEMEEEKRLLYVGMTRAEEYLVLSKENVFGNKHGESTWMEILSDFGFISSIRWSIPAGMEDIVEIKLSSPKKWDNEIVSPFTFDESYLVVPDVKIEKQIYNVTELFEKESSASSKMTVYGNIAHEIFEQVGLQKLKDVLKRPLFSVYPSKMVEEVKKTISKFVDDPLVTEIENSKNAISELAIEIGIPEIGIQIIGKIDKVTDERIIDFKYSYYSEEKLKDYEFQVKIYMMAYHKLTGIKKSGVIFFLKDGKKISVDYPDESKLMAEIKTKRDSR